MFKHNRIAHRTEVRSMDQLIPSLAALVEPFRDCFHSQVFATFQTLIAGWIVCVGPRTISEVWQATGLAARRHHDTAYAVFHSACWARVLSESYGYSPAYFVSFRGGAIEALFPFMEVDSTLTGKRGVSLPFTDYCEPVVPEGLDIRDMVGDIIRFGKEYGWRYAEFRGGGSLPAEYQPSSTYVGHMLDSGRDEEAILSSFNQGTRRNIRKAEKFGVKVTVSRSLEAVRAFFSLNCMTRRRHGLPPQPFRFFAKLHEHVLLKGHGVVALAEHDGKPVAGGIYFHFGGKAVYKYGASDKRYQDLKANNLVMWEAIRYYAARGCRSFCFGRTEPSNEGLLQFKSGWGTRERTLNYHKYDLGRGAYVTGSLGTHGLHNSVFSNMPMPLLRLTGSLLYRHMG